MKHIDLYLAISILVLIGVVLVNLDSHALETAYCSNNGSATTCFTYHQDPNGTYEHANGNSDLPDESIIYNTNPNNGGLPQ